MTHKLFKLLSDLESKSVHFTLSRQRSESTMVSCTLVSLRLEIDVFEDGHFEYSVFKGDESVLSEESDLMAQIELHN